MNWTALTAALTGAPSLPGARCRGRSHLFDPVHQGEPAEVTEAHAQSLGLCNRCPALDACETYFISLRPTQRPEGVIAGRIHNRPNRKGQP